MSIYSFKWLHSILWFSLCIIFCFEAKFISLLLLDLFKLTFQCMELPAPLVAATAAANYWLYLGLFSLPLSLLLHFAHCFTQLSVSSLLSSQPPPTVTLTSCFAPRCAGLCFQRSALSTELCWPYSLPMALLVWILQAAFRLWLSHPKGWV